MISTGKTLSQCHYVHQKSHTDCPGIEAHKQEQKPEYRHILRNASRTSFREEEEAFCELQLLWENRNKYCGDEMLLFAAG
jgi:hypothetical protein